MSDWWRDNQTQYTLSFLERKTPRDSTAATLTGADKKEETVALVLYFPRLHNLLPDCLLLSTPVSFLSRSLLLFHLPFRDSSTFSPLLLLDFLLSALPPFPISSPSLHIPVYLPAFHFLLPFPLLCLYLSTSSMHLPSAPSLFPVSSPFSLSSERYMGSLKWINDLLLNIAWQEINLFI